MRVTLMNICSSFKSKIEIGSNYNKLINQNGKESDNNP